MGDFNLDLLGVDKCKPTADFLELMFSFYFMPVINKPTRVNKESATIIDNMFCNKVYTQTLINGILYTDISDHFPIFSINMSADSPATVDKIYRRVYSEKNIVRFRDMLRPIALEIFCI